jgi:tagatose-1,6-bisphosphate aldolase
MRSAQRARALDRLASPRGVIAGAACDHRDSLQAVLAKRGLELDAAGITDLKLRVAAALAPAATMILLDAEYSAAQAIAAGALPGARVRTRRAAAGSPSSSSRAPGAWPRSSPTC